MIYSEICVEWNSDRLSWIGILAITIKRYGDSERCWEDWQVTSRLCVQNQCPLPTDMNMSVSLPTLLSEPASSWLTERLWCMLEIFTGLNIPKGEGIDLVHYPIVQLDRSSYQEWVGRSFIHANRGENQSIRKTTMWIRKTTIPPWGQPFRQREQPFHHEDNHFKRRDNHSIMKTSIWTQKTTIM